MNGQRRQQFTGVFPGPYRVGEPTKSDIPVTGEGPDGPVVVGRFPRTKVTDGEAQAKAYAALPAMVAALRAVLRSDLSARAYAQDALDKAGIDA